MKVITARMKKGWQLTLFVENKVGANTPHRFQFIEKFYDNHWEAMEALTNAKNRITKEKTNGTETDE